MIAHLQTQPRHINNQLHKDAAAEKYKAEKENTACKHATTTLHQKDSSKVMLRQIIYIYLCVKLFQKHKFKQTR